jgi:hypothetical protein
MNSLSDYISPESLAAFILKAHLPQSEPETINPFSPEGIRSHIQASEGRQDRFDEILEFTDNELKGVLALYYLGGNASARSFTDGLSMALNHHPETLSVPISSKGPIAVNIIKGLYKIGIHNAEQNG